jgi:hypothetical protein
VTRARPARLALVLALLAPAACKSSAPYTVPSAAINMGLAAGVSALQRTQGGCYAQCVGGTVCNPVTGFCEQRNLVCLGMESDPPSCLARPGATMGTAAQVPGAAGETVSPLGISPATGGVPPPPSSASPAPTRP